MAWDDGDDNYVSPGVPQRQDVKWYLLEDADSKVKWFTGFLVLVSLGMLIAGSVMLGIGISKNNNPAPPPVTTTDSGYTMFLTVQTRALPYSAVVNDYAGSVKNLTDQMRQAIALPKASANIQVTDQNNIPITILGISNAGQWADVMYAFSYLNSNKPSLTDIQTRVTASPGFAFVSATDKTAPALKQMTCSSVSDSTLTTTVGTTTTPVTGSTVNVPTTSVYPGTASITTVTTQPPVTNTNPVITTVSPKNPVTSPVTKPTEKPRTTTTPFVKTPYSKDVIILLDDSKAMMSPKNFNMAKSWIVNSLLPLWIIDRENVQVAFATYADKEFNTLLDFDEANEAEVASVIAAQMYSGKYNSSITNGIRAAGDIHGLRPVNQTVIMISASEDLTDIESASKYAYIINTLPKQLITVTLNSATSGKQLGLLSTNQNHFFGISNFNLTTDIAQQLTQYMFGTLTPTTQAPTTTAVPDNSCKTDVTILIDNNNDVGSASEYMNQIRTISKLIKTWPISPDIMEGEAIVFATTQGGKILDNPFAYQSASTFANEVIAFDDFYFATSPPTLTASLQYVSQNLYLRRPNREQTTIVFTYSSENNDVQSAVPFANHIGGNLIVVAVGNADPAVLKQLSGNVIYAKNMTTDIIYQVNNLLCSPTTKAPLITSTTTIVTSGPSSTVAPTTTVIPTTQPRISTSPMPDPCPDCSPKTSNILLLLQAAGPTLSQQKTLIETNLIANWNHFERTSLMGYDTLVKNLDPINFGDLQDKDEFVGIAASLIPFTDQPTIVSAFNLAVKRAQPLPQFGKMNSVIFTTGATSSEISASLANSQTLRANGKIIIVGLQLADSTGLDTLCDVLLKWDDLTNSSTISNQINQALNS